MPRVNLKSAMSGRPHGPYTVKKGQRVTNAGRRGEVHDPRWPPRLEQGLHRRGIGDVDSLELKVLAGQARQTRLLQRRIVVGVEVVDAEHLVAAVEETPRHVV